MQPEQFQNVFANIISEFEPTFARFWTTDDAKWFSCGSCPKLAPVLKKWGISIVNCSKKIPKFHAFECTNFEIFDSGEICEN